MAKLEGFVSKLNTRQSKPDAKRPWTLYSFLVELADGTESPWVSFGFEQPPFKEGDYIAFETDEKDNRHNYKKGSGSKPANPPERAKPKQQQTAGSPAVANPKGVSTVGAALGAPADRQTAIVMQHSQEMAITAVGILLANSALSISGNSAKAGEAKRFSEIMAAFDKLTVKFYNDAASGRLLDTVSDTVIDTTPDAPLPTKKAGPVKDAAANDDDMDSSGGANAATPGGF